MKKLINSISPFVLLLIPMLVLILLSTMNKNIQIAEGKSRAFKLFRMPSLPQEVPAQTGNVKFIGNSIEIFF